MHSRAVEVDSSSATVVGQRPQASESRPLLMSGEGGAGGGSTASDMRKRLTKTLSLNRQKNDNVDPKGNGKMQAVWCQSWHCLSDLLITLVRVQLRSLRAWHSYSMSEASLQNDFRFCPT